MDKINLTNKIQRAVGPLPKFPGCIVLLFLALLTGANGISQNAQYSIFEIDENLSRGLIKDVVTDSLGYVWTATDEGAVRFDGEETTFFKDAIKGGFAKAFCNTKNGKLLVLHDFGLTEIVSRPDTVHFIQILNGGSPDVDTALHYPKTIYEDKNGTLWIGENQSIVRYRDGELKKFRFNNNMEFGIISRSYSFSENANGVLWAISHSGQLSYFDPAKDGFVKQKMDTPISEVSSLTKIRGSTCWAGTKNGFYELELIPTKKPIRLIAKGGPPSISCTALLNGNELFAGTWNGGVFRADLEKTPLAFQRIEQLSFNDIIGFSFDENNGLWACGHENIALLKPVLFEIFDFNTQVSPTISSIGLNPDRSILVITDQLEINTQEIYFIDKDRIKWKMGLPDNPVGNIPMAALFDDKKLWVGDLGGELYSFEKNTNKAVKWSGIFNSNSPISSIKKDPEGNLWIAGNKNDGLIRIDKNGKTFFYKNSGLENCKIIYLTKNKELFAGGTGAENYLYKYDRDKDVFINYSLPFGSKVSGNFEVIDIIENKSGDLFLATNSGVMTYRLSEPNKKIIHLDLQEVPISEPTNALAISKDGTLWASTTSGLVAYNDHSSFLFDRLSGLPSNNLSDRGLLFDHEDNLWVATARGLAVFKRSNSNFKITPKPFFNAVIANEINYGLQPSCQKRFPFNSSLEIGFISLSYPTARVKYRSRILEKDTAWSSPNSMKHRFLGGLSPGEYTFQVSAQQQEGMLWSEAASLKFEIMKPWFLRWWVMLLFFIFSVGLVALVTRLYNINLIKQKKKLELTIKERTEEVNRKNREIIEQQKHIIEQNEHVRKLKEIQYQNDLEHKNKQLTTHTLNLIQKNQTLKDLRLKINQTIRSSSKSSYQEMRRLLNLIDYSFRKDEEWDNFKLYFEEVHVGFFEELIARHSKLTSQDLRHCALIRLNLSIEEMATIIGISADSIKTARFRLKKKMELDSNMDLLEYLMKV